MPRRALPPQMGTNSRFSMAKPCKGFGDNTLWIITEADRSATTFLLPDEY
jgi:hypothetical protein